MKWKLMKRLKKQRGAMKFHSIYSEASYLYHIIDLQVKEIDRLSDELRKAWYEKHKNTQAK